jgi:phosphohistidine phosphatase
MRQLLLLRHAKSSWDDPGLSDHARPLNARGRRAAAAMGGAMRDLGLQPDLVIVSSARRTLQTLEALTPFDDNALIEPMDSLYLAHVSLLLDGVRKVPETVRSVLMIGHNPGLHELALTLVGDGAASAGRPRSAAVAAAERLEKGFPTGALAEFTIAVPWRAVAAGSGRLVRFLAPRDLLDEAREPPS